MIPSKKITLTVRNSVNGSPLSGALVELRRGVSNIVMTEIGTSGVYNVDSIAVGEYSVYINAADSGDSYVVQNGELDAIGFEDGAIIQSTEDGFIYLTTADLKTALSLDLVNNVAVPVPIVADAGKVPTVNGAGAYELVEPTVPTVNIDNETIEGSNTPASPLRVMDNSNSRHDVVKDFTGLVSGHPNDHNNILIDQSYDSTTRTCSIVGPFKLWYLGSLILDIAEGVTWTSIANPNEAPASTQFLKYNGDGFSWVSAPWKFTEVQIIYACYKSNGEFCFAQRECHGLMDWESHESFHYKIGTTLISGGDMSGFVLASTTATNRRPLISSTTMSDEDCWTTNPALDTNSYGWFFLSGASAEVNITASNPEIIDLSGNQPYWNQFTGGAWQQTLFTANDYGAIFVIALPATSDAISQSKRYMFVQPQVVNSNPGVIQALNTASLNLSEFKSISPEFVFIGKIIIRFTAGNWSLTSVEKLTGSRVNQTVAPSGNISIDSVVGLQNNLFVTSDADLTIANNIALAVLTGETARTFTLPTANALGANRSQLIRIKNLSSASLTLSRAGSDDIVASGATSVVTTISIASGAQAIVASNGISVWYQL